MRDRIEFGDNGSRLFGSVGTQQVTWGFGKEENPGEKDETPEHLETDGDTPRDRVVRGMCDQIENVTQQNTVFRLKKRELENATEKINKCEDIPGDDL